MQKISNKQLNKMGNILRVNPKDDDVLTKVSQWRDLHIHPLLSFQRTLYRKVKEKNRLIAKRLKRMPTILDKLQRYEDTQLSRMQDIGGIRVILNNIDEVNKLAIIYNKSTTSFKKVGYKNYILNPKDSGYRGIHIIYQYICKRKSDEHKELLNNLKIELQIRTRLQHTWATAVEMAGIFKNENLKSSIGNEDWLDFFSIVGSSFAYMEETTCLTQHVSLSKEEIFKQVVQKSKLLRVKEIFPVLGDSLSFMKKINKEYSDRKYKYYVIKLDLTQEDSRDKIQLWASTQENFEEASKKYQELEKETFENKACQVVLVSADKINEIQQIYQNFFLDTRDFLNALDKIEKSVDENSTHHHS